MAASRRRRRLRRCSARTGSESPYRTRPENKMGPARVSFLFSGGEGGMAASRPHLRLRRCLSRTGLSSSTTLGEKSKMGPQGPHFQFLAERVGFEPTVRCNRTPDFESGPFDHSGTSPLVGSICHPGVLRTPVHLIGLVAMLLALRARGAIVRALWPARFARCSPA